MLYLTKKLSQAYDNLKDIIDEEKDLKIYAIPLGYETIKIDINKTFEDLKYISSSDKDFYLLEFTAPETLKKFTELPLNDWKRIFFDFFGENGYSIYSENLTDEDYKKIIQKIRKDYSDKEKINFSYLLIFILGLFAISQGVELVYDEKPIDKDFFIKQLSLYKNKILDFVGKKYPSSLENIKSLFENGSNYNSFNLKNYFEKLENETPFFILSNLSDKQLLSFLYLFHFVTKPLEKISCEDIKSLARDFCQIEKNDFERNINNNFLLKNENLNILRAKSNYVEFFFRLGKEKNLNLPQFYFEKLYFKFTLLKICAIEKIYKYISLNLSEYKEIENILEKTILKENFKKQVSFNKGKVVLKSFWKEYLECLENIFPCVEKSFYFNNFFRMQLFYRKGILEKLSDIENNSKKGENFYKKLDTSKGNFKKLKYSEREIGNDNYKRIISYYESILSSEKQDKTTEEIEKIKKNKTDFILIYMLLQRYKLIYDIKMNLNSEDKKNFIKYNNYIGLGDIYEFKIDVNEYENNINILGRTVCNFSYQKHILKVYELKQNEYYIVEVKDGSKNILLLQYLGKMKMQDQEKNKLFFRNDREIKIYFEDEINIREIKYLEFLEPREQEHSLL